MRKIRWLLFSLLLIASMILVSCGKAAEPTETGTTVQGTTTTTTNTTTTPTPTTNVEMVKDSLGRTVEKPRYGGTFTMALTSDIMAFDEVYSLGYGPAVCTSMHLTHEKLGVGDWLKGPIGSNKASWKVDNYFDNLTIGMIAESWEIPDPDTIIFHIRRGVTYANSGSEASKLANGREVTAADVVFSWNRTFVPGQAKYGFYTPEESNAVKVTAPEKYTVVVKNYPGVSTTCLREFANYTYIIPPEVVNKYGDMRDWKNSVGTGPYMLTDYVPGSVAGFVANTNYWRQHPLYPEDRMPYIKNVKWMIIPDPSTRIAGLRTGKIDSLTVPWQQVPDVKQSNPDLIWQKTPPTQSTLIFMRTDKPELPFSNIKVRQALQLGLDNQSIIVNFYRGDAVLINHPISSFPEFKDMYTPLEGLPKTVQELYGYYPDKARQLLTEAGYPKGFTTSVVCTETYVDILSIIKADWAKIGVTLNLEVTETSVFRSIGSKRSHKDMIVGGGITDANPSGWDNYLPDNPNNKSMINDARVNQAIAEWFSNEDDWAKCCQIIKGVTPYILEQAWTVPLPSPYTQVAWWPWLKDYHGENAIGNYEWYDYVKYIWIDQGMKKGMGY